MLPLLGGLMATTRQALDLAYERAASFRNAATFWMCENHLLFASLQMLRNGEFPYF
jgi:hypothetical protein